MLGTINPLQLSISDRVKENLEWYNGWKNVETKKIRTRENTHTQVLCGSAPAQTGNPNQDAKQWIVPLEVSRQHQICVDDIDKWFQELGRISDGCKPSRIIVGLVGDDSTVVYYYIHEGVIKPR